MPNQPARSPVLLFDVNETLLDLAPIRKSVNEILLDDNGANLWFSMMLHHSLVMTVSDQHADFAEIGAAVLQMLARNRDIALTADESRQALGAMRRLPAHPDVAPALARLKRAGYRLATLTNSSQAGVEAQLSHSGLTDFFEQQLSVQTPRRYKPYQAVYTWAATAMAVTVPECMLVAAHGWDVAGAKWAGMKTAFIARPGQQIFPLAVPPDLNVADFAALADALGA